MPPFKICCLVSFEINTYRCLWCLKHRRKSVWRESCFSVAPMWRLNNTHLLYTFCWKCLTMVATLNLQHLWFMSVLHFFSPFYRYEASKEARLAGQQPSSQESGRTGRGRRGGGWGREEGVGRPQGQTRTPPKQQQCHDVPGVPHSAELQRPGPDPLQREDAPKEAAAISKGC